MNIHAVYHEPKSRWAYAADTKTLHLRLRSAKGDCKCVRAYAADPFCWFAQKDGTHGFDYESIIERSMELEYSDALYDYWFCAISEIPTTRIRYAFVLGDGSKEYSLGPDGVGELAGGVNFKTNVSFMNYFNYPCINDGDIFAAPEWAAKTVWYQIFPERFSRGSNSEPDENLTPWDEEPEAIGRVFYGGNLRGIIEKLPYVRSIGFTGIYLTPIFTSQSTHKYDTADYFSIDPHFGTNEEFGELVEKAHSLGIKIMLDAVFNHCGFEHPFFQDVVKNGRKSKYFNCFYIDSEPVLNFELKNGQIPDLTADQQRSLPFRTFAFTPRMPKWNADDPFTREYLLSVGKYWIEKYDIDGWRLDVSNEVSHSFWRDFRREMLSVKPDIFILGENWDNAMPWLGGDQFDSVMNYGFLHPVWRFLAPEKNSGAAELKNDLVRLLLAGYPKTVQPYLFNMVDNHDTTRIITTCGGNPDAAAIGYALLFTFAGSPSVYYGGEIGLDGPIERDKNRRPMPWNEDKHNLKLKETIQKLIAIREKYPSARAVQVNWLICEGKTLVYEKRHESERLCVMINASDSEVSIKLPSGLSETRLTDLMEGVSLEKRDEAVLKPFSFMVLLSK